MPERLADRHIAVVVAPVSWRGLHAQVLPALAHGGRGRLLDAGVLDQDANLVEHFAQLAVACVAFQAPTLAIGDTLMGNFVSIFDTVTRSSTEPKQGTESTFDFLQRVAGDFWDDVRQLLEEWVEHLPPGERADIVGRLQSGDEVDFKGAVWELFLHECLIQMGFQVTFHPQVPNTTTHPDFLAESDDCSFYLEATVVHEDEANRGNERRKAVIYEEINKRVNSDDVFLHVEFPRESKDAPAVGKLGKALGAYLANDMDLDTVRDQYDSGGLLDVDSFTWDDSDNSGWVVRATPIPKASPGRSDRIVGVMGGSAGTVDDVSPIRKSLTRKAGRYGKSMNRPYVIALQSDRKFTDEIDVMSALFGDEVVHIDRITGDSNLSLIPNGLWRQKKGHAATNVSAVVATSDFGLPYQRALTLDCYMHPAPDMPLECETDFMRTRRVEHDGTVIDSEPTDAPPALRSLPAEWPRGKPFPKE